MTEELFILGYFGIGLAIIGVAYLFQDKDVPDVNGHRAMGYLLIPLLWPLIVLMIPVFIGEKIESIRERKTLNDQNVDISKLEQGDEIRVGWVSKSSDGRPVIRDFWCKFLWITHNHYGHEEVYCEDFNGDTDTYGSDDVREVRADRKG